MIPVQKFEIFAVKSEGKPALSKYLSDMVKLARSGENERFLCAFSSFNACLRTLFECDRISLYEYCYTYEKDMTKIFDYLCDKYFGDSRRVKN